MTPDELKKYFPNISQDCLQKTLGVGAVLPAVRKQNSVPALDRNSPAKPNCARRLGLIITLISCRKRLLDDDNNIASLKHLRDCIADTICINDADPRIRWQYGQQRTDGEQGTIVVIEQI